MLFGPDSSLHREATHPFACPAKFHTRPETSFRINSQIPAGFVARFHPENPASHPPRKPYHANRSDSWSGDYFSSDRIAQNHRATSAVSVFRDYSLPTGLSLPADIH